MAKSQTKEEIHELAKERFKEIVDFEGSERDVMEDDKIFALGENDGQWEEDARNSRKNSRRSFLTIMRSNQFTDHIKNQQRQNKPSIKISPTDEGAQEEVAERRQGLIRHIQYESKANQARQAGFDDAVDEGRGHWIVKTEFVPNTFHSKIVVDPIQDSRSVYMDWRRQRPDYSDCKYGFVITRISRKEFEEKNPDATLDAWDNRNSDMWFTEKDVMVAEYYCEMYKTRKLIEVAGVGEEEGQTKILFEDELTEKISDERILQSREVEDPYWMWYKMSGSEILEEEDLPWKEIPIITVIGKENVVDGHWSCKGLIRDIKQSLRTYNFLASNEADIIAKAPRAPWVGAAGQFEGFEDQYANSNVADEATLEYNPVSINGTMAPPPQRAQFSVDLRNLLEAKNGCIEDIKAITGIYDASIGQRSNETSGVAIRAREAQGNNANFHYIDNYAMAINHEGRVINSALNVIYDTARTITIMGEDDEEKLLAINGEGDAGLGEGNFNTTVSVGPSFNTQREEQAAGLLEMSSNSGLVQETAMDEVVSAQDWNGKDMLVKRLRKAISLKYPGLITETDESGKMTEIDVLEQQLNQAQEQMQQMQQQMQQLQEALEKAGADKQAAEAGKIQVEMKKLELDQQRVQLEGQKIVGELQLKSKELEQDMLKTDLTVSSQVKMSDDKNQTEMLKTVHSSNSEMSKLDKTHAIAEKSKVEDNTKVDAKIKAEVDKVLKLLEAKEVKSDKPEKKKTIVKKLNNGNYSFESTSSDGEVTKGIVKTKGKDGYVIESKETDGKSGTK